MKKQRPDPPPEEPPKLIGDPNNPPSASETQHDSQDSGDKC